MLLIIVKVPAKRAPLTIDPTAPRLPRLSGAAWIGPDVLHDSIEMLFVANNPIIRFLLPKVSAEGFGPVDEPGRNTLYRADFNFEFVGIEWAHDET